MTRYSLVVLKVPLNTNQTNNVYILTHRLYVACERHRDVYCYDTAVYMHIHITLVTEGSSLDRRSPVAHEKMIVNPPSMLVEQHCVIY